MSGWKSPLLATFVLAVVLLAGVSAWLLTDPATTRADAVRTGGLAGGAVVALYALWLNDRRRKVEENRQQVERERYELELLRAERDRERVTDERFAKAVELLGNEADQVRVGALHALAGVARSRPDYTQTVLDVFCAYLRRPFEDGLDQHERQVRLTAQRLIVELLPPADSDEPSFDLDLTGAVLEYFDANGRKFARLILRAAQLHNTTHFSRCVFTGPAWFTRMSTKDGRFVCRSAVFGERAWFSGAEFDSLADAAEFGGTKFLGAFELREARFDGHADLRPAEPPNTVSLYNTLVHPARAKLPEHWSTETVDGRTRIVDRRG